MPETLESLIAEIVALEKTQAVARRASTTLYDTFKEAQAVANAAHEAACEDTAAARRKLSEFMATQFEAAGSIIPQR